MPTLAPRTRYRLGRTDSFHVAAPIGGDDTVSPGTAVPPQCSIFAYNLIGAELGLRSRLGWREWVTGLDGDPRSLLPFTGSTASGSNNRLFACTQSGIWDVSSSTATPTQVVTFGTQSVDSGYGASTVFVTAAGHFLVYTDEDNGMYVYAETGATWTKVVRASNTAWAPNTAYLAGAYVSNQGLTYQCATPGTSIGTPWVAGHAYVLGDIVSLGGNTYTCTQAGTSAGSGGPTGTGSSIVDGGATWQYTPLGPTGSGAGITDGSATWNFAPSISGVDPAKIVSVLAWKNRLWLIEKDSARAWYLGINSLYGTAYPFNFGARFVYGGDLRCLASYTGDGGSGMDDRLVAVSGAGDVVIYAGTDPAQASTFELVGVWFVGSVPVGRRLTTTSGGDVLVMSSLGIMPVSKLVIGNIVLDRSQYQTFKISNLFNQLQAATSTLRGWAMRVHPQDSCLMVLVPVASGQPTTQLVMSLTTRGWSRYRDMPMGICAEPWNGTLYFGSGDGTGRVLVNDGYLDGVLLSNPSAYSTIDWSLLTAYSQLGTPRRKRIQRLRIKVLSQGGAIPLNAEARYGLDMSEAAPPPASAASVSGAAWDAALWDQGKWGGGYQVQAQTFGAFGDGPEVALAIRGSASSRMTFVGADVEYETGSFQ